MTQSPEHQGYSNAGLEIVTKLKNTMSDRASAQKSFNSLLADYRASTLPSAINNWETLTEAEKSCMCEMYHFFCSMHLVVNMAEHTAEALPLFESAEGMTDDR